VREADSPRDRERAIDVNSATEGELTALPGIGPATARRIIERRPYRVVEDLLRVKGMSWSRLFVIGPFIVLK
jgi:competence protein ComEA